MIERTVRIVNRLGLHARAAAKLVALASRFSSEIQISKGDKRVSGKSIMGVMMLAAAQGSQVTLHAEGNDAAEALDALQALIADKFGEGA